MGVQHARDGRSATLSYDGATFVGSRETIRPLRDHIIVEPMMADYHSAVLVVVVDGGKTLRGRVKAVGPGHYPKRYDHRDKGRRRKMWDSKYFKPAVLRVGDVVELGGYDHGGFSFQKFMWGDTMHIICREADVCGIVETREATREAQDGTQKRQFEQNQKSHTGTSGTSGTSGGTGAGSHTGAPDPR